MGLGNGMANNRGVVPARRVGLVLATAIMPALAAAAPAHAMPVWNPAAFVSPAGSSAASPQIALDAQGNAIAVWVVSGTNNEVVYSDHPAGGSWTAPVALSDPAEGAGAPVVAVDAHADAFVAWSQGNNNNIRIRASYRPAGGSWQATTDVLSAANVVSVSPRLTVDGGGDEAIGWVQNDSGFTYTTMYGDYRAAGGAWKIPQALSQTTTSQLVEQPAGTFDPQGNATFVWVYEATGSHAVIETSTYIKSPGLWSLFPGVLSNASHDSIGPQIASDHAGDLSAVWQESTTGPVTQIMGADRPSGMGWKPAQAVETATGPSVGYPAVAFDPAGDTGRGLAVRRQFRDRDDPDLDALGRRHQLASERQRPHRQSAQPPEHDARGRSQRRRDPRVDRPGHRDGQLPRERRDSAGDRHVGVGACPGAQRRGRGRREPRGRDRRTGQRRRPVGPLRRIELPHTGRDLLEPVDQLGIDPEHRLA